MEPAGREFRVLSVLSPSLLLHYLLSFDFAGAAWTTLWISLASLLLGMVVGLALAIGQEAPFRVIRHLVLAYLWLFRGTPVLLQLVFAFNVLPAFGLVLPGTACAVLALGLNEGAYMAEIMRAGIHAVGRGQRVAARALGLEEGQIMRWVVLPQALRIVIPPIGNQFIGMLKLSALVSVIGVQELLLTADQTASANFRYIETLTAAGIYYLALTTVFMLAQSWLERALSRRPGRRSGALVAQAVR
ncbi:MAG TPA: amino acid ABC transporter permease [Rhodopila sp.]|uniref:amino acid ABC transporter permease n=1 Tax=Rhodopila sp. TaxID=2480087 RepID=UPI002BFD6C57|nr:amino acid ABC transporter permease [Rhodopila sp.]HVY15825.1 amino acid ABC transporter permease [Rhodopila sp.]